MDVGEYMAMVPFEMDVELQFLQGVVDRPAQMAVALLELAGEECFFTPQHRVLRRHIKAQLDDLMAKGETTARINFLLLLKSLQTVKEYPDGFPITEALLELVSPRQGSRPSYSQCFHLAQILRDLESRRSIRNVALQLLETAATGGREKLQGVLSIVHSFSSSQKARQG